MATKIKIYPTREYLLECFDYKKETGELFWKKRPADHFDRARDYRIFVSRFCGKEITGEQITIGGRNHAKSIIIFKILNGFDPVGRPKKNGSVCKNKGGFKAEFSAGSKKLQKWFKTEAEAKEWVKEMRLCFEKNILPIHKARKVSKHGFHGVDIKENGKIFANVRTNGRTISLGSFKTKKEASDAHLLAKQQIKDGCFVAPPRKLNATGFIGVKPAGAGMFKSFFKGIRLGTFPTAELAHAAYLKAKNPPPTIANGLDMLRQLASDYQEYQGAANG